MLSPFWSQLKTVPKGIVTVVGVRVRQRTQALQETLVGGAVSDVTRGTHELIAENALLHQQVIVLK